MEKRKATYKEMLLFMGYIVIICAYEFVEYFDLIPGNSLLGVFLGFVGIISITLVYLVFVQKESTIKLISHIKILLPYLAIPAFISFLILAALPLFLPTRSNLFDLIVVLVVIGTAVSWLVIMHRVPRPKGDVEAHKANRGRKDPGSGLHS
jgi:hypothetical protein